MQNFEYYNPVKIVFGKGTIQNLATYLPKCKKIMMTYGGGSIKKNGVYDQVKKALKGFNVVEFGGIEPNPTYETCMEAVKMAKKENVDFLLAVGGGSVLDGTKFIAAAIKFKGKNPWDIILKQGENIKSAVPLASVITLPATGSEMNSNSVISKKETAEKYAFYSSYVYPQFSIIDPEVTYSLPKGQLINGIVDSFVHVIEQYITAEELAPLQERQSEAILSTLIEVAPKVLGSKKDYEAMATFFWCSSNALNGLAASGVYQDWATHKIGHELTAIYGIDHAQSLAVVLPRLLANQIVLKKNRLLQYGERIWGITGKDKDKTCQKIIDQTEKFFNSLGMKTKLSDYKIDEKKAAIEISTRAKARKDKWGETGKVTHMNAKEILLNC